MHAYLITGGTKDQRLTHIREKQQQWSVSSFDCLRLAPMEESIGIASVRELQKQLLLAPLASSKKLGIIEDSHLMTMEAQNALLKTLEEPPPQTVLFLESPTAESLLPTIVSRCQVVTLATPKSSEQTTDSLSECFKTLEQAATLPVGKRLALVDELAKTREGAKQWVADAIVAIRHLMLSSYDAKASKRYTMLLRSLLTAQSQLTANVTPKLVVDNILLRL